MLAKILFFCSNTGSVKRDFPSQLGQEMKEFFSSTVGTRILAGTSILLILVIGYRYYSNRITPEKIAAGKILFEHEFTQNDPLTPRGDGLGPVFNDVSCVACHFQGGTGGAGPNTKNVQKFLVMPTSDRRNVQRGVIHKHATQDDLLETIDKVKERYPDLPGSQRQEGCYTMTTPPVSPVMTQSINTPALFGLGLIEKIPSYSIAYHGTTKTLSNVANEFRGKFTTKGIGRINMSGTTVGKFGWRGEFGTIEDFVAEACAVELGLSVPGRKQDEPNSFQEDPYAKNDLSRKQLHELVCFVKSLPRPEQVLPTDPVALNEVKLGEKVFVQVGCADCHVQDMGGVEGIYSDFHLYQLSKPDLDTYDNLMTNQNVQFPLGETEPDEWKTPPLWGVADSAPYMHDGSCQSLEMAISMHHGDGEYSRKAYQEASYQDQRALIAFLKTLRAPKMDAPQQTDSERIARVD